ncbi:hypothetical protein GCM10023188_00370 [Pontibacter saemangeumensis]|uniref:DUF4349 domain-containing protein n=1 Tax=Pontibacter saemangeumensis TaxID=1084525 RepID=A0ABP8L5N0_9BACT
MNKFFTWEFANKLAIIFGIIGGIYILYQFIDYLLTEELKFETEIFIVDYQIPVDKRKQYYSEESEAIIPRSFDSYYLSRNIRDSLEKIIDFSKYSTSDIKESIENSIPKEFDQRLLIDRIDSLLLRETYPLRNTNYFLYSKLKNNSNNIVKELRFELPARGYYELYLNDDLVRKGDFQSNINIGELRPDNASFLKIWSFDYINKHQLSGKDIKYTFENGIIIPTLLDTIKAKGFIYWVYDNIIWAVYLLIILPIYLTLMIVLNLKFFKKNKKATE